MKKIKGILVIALTLFCAACSAEKEEAVESESSVSTELPALKEVETPYEAERMAFNQITLGKEADEFAGGSKLADLENLFGPHNKKESQPAGDVTLDIYTWNKDAVTIVAQLYKDSTVAASISNFAFNRPAKIELKDFEELKEGMTYTQVTDRLGQPDVLSQSVSTGRQDLQALWVSGLYTETGARIELIFEQGSLKKLTQVGLTAKPNQKEDK